MGICPACDYTLTWRHNGVWCDRCHRKVETCCEGAPQCPVDPVGTASAQGLPAKGPC